MQAQQEAQEKQQLLMKQKLELENKLQNNEKDLKKVSNVEVSPWKFLLCNLAKLTGDQFISLEKALEDHEETKEVSKRVQLLLKEETAAVQTKLVRKD